MRCWDFCDGFANPSQFFISLEAAQASRSIQRHTLLQLYCFLIQGGVRSVGKFQENKRSDKKMLLGI